MAWRCQPVSAPGGKRHSVTLTFSLSICTVGVAAGRFILSPAAVSRAFGALGIAVPPSSRFQRLADLDFQTARGGHVVAAVRHLVGKVTLARGRRAPLARRPARSPSAPSFFHT